ncbi:MAG TPA: type IV secretion system DNA-binding domain-containing protein [Patescibacteria group bacterium]|nr:type IV secretion system DNA-binding domain-containing protein [Patescibacteria group bacterium]
MNNLVSLVLKLPRNTEITPEAAQTFLAALTQINSVSFFQKLTGVYPQALALEIALINQQIKFQITCDETLAPFIETQIQSNYPLVIIEKSKDPLEGQNIEAESLILRKGSYYPIAIFSAFTDIDPMASILSVLSKSDPEQIALIQYALESTSSSWQRKGESYSEKGTKNEDGSYSPRPDASVIKEKISYPGFKVSIRIAGNTNKTLTELKSAFGVFARSDGNSFSTQKKGILNHGSIINSLYLRRVTNNQILNIQELATIWHLPSEKIKTSSIAWGTSVLSEPPENLPDAISATEEDKKEINFFARTLFRNKDTIFGVKNLDRLRHIWTVGKTGTGKSTMMANMIIDDFKKDRGVTYIDPHGDTCDVLLDYIPGHRLNDTVYFNPADKDFPITINPLEVTNREEAELVVSGLMSIFTKVWANVWSARMEYILRNSFMTLAEQPNTTLEDVLKILANKNYRDRILEKTKDSALVHFWIDEYEKMPDRLQKEAIAPIQNKVGQFVTSPMIRRIIGHPKSSISIDDILNQEKILLANLSQGRLGEDNANLLGAMLITKIQLAAMRRVDTPINERKPYYVFVDEFQNFATDSFIKILSEIRKYNLSLCLANQYMAQIPENVRKAILGNAGTIITFSAGAEDAAILNKEFAEVFSENDLVNLSNYQIAIKLMIDGHSSRPFLAHTLPLPISKNQNRPKVISISRERWTQKEKAPYTEEPAYIPHHPTYQRRFQRPQRETSRGRHFPPRRENYRPNTQRPITSSTELKPQTGNIFQGPSEEKQNQS